MVIDPSAAPVRHASSVAAPTAVEARYPERGATVGITGLDERSARPHSTPTGEPAGKG
ncbi:hypothetical protein ACFV19_25775 [Streptomyces griseoluteus]|uniref:hypothetical protein n=1 Tax=Streptomyces griseoluteus TaxID=29306 RepID=UPI0036A829BE